MIQYVKQKPLVTVAVLTAIFSTAFVFIASPKNSLDAFNKQTVDLQVGAAEIKTEVVKTSADLERGLSGRKSLNDGEGMLFAFDDYKVRTFWMKDMKFPLDIIWISDGLIIGADKNLPPEGDTPQKTYSSPGPANQVLEVPAGWLDKNGIKVGDVVAIK